MNHFPSCAPAPQRTAADTAAVLPRLADQLTRARTVEAAAQEVVDFAVRAGLPLPSLYLERGGRLRCIAQHGYWQVFDGIGPGTGVAGTTYATGKRSVVLDVAASHNYIAAYPAVIAEICEPIRVDGRTVGVLNVESPIRLTTADAQLVEQIVALLAERLAALGGPPLESPAERLARFGSELMGLSAVDDIARATLEVAVELSGMSSAALLLTDHTEPRPVACTGPLGPVIEALPASTLGRLAYLVHMARSCYTSEEEFGVGSAGMRDVIEAGVGSLAVVALVVGASRQGVLVAADERRGSRSAEVSLLELLAAQAGASLRTVTTANALHDSERRFRALAEHASDLVCLHTRGGRIVYASPSARAVIDADAESLVGVDGIDLCHVDDRDRVRREVADGLPSGRVTVAYRRPDSGKGTLHRWLESAITPVLDEGGAVSHLQTTTRDITKRKRAEERLAHQASRDPLTGLRNRAALISRLESVLELKPGGHPVAVLFVDLDGFKAVNDTFGHAAGDELLVAVAGRLKSTARRGDTVGRLGGDEFALLCEDARAGGIGAQLAKRLAVRLAEPFHLDVGTVCVSASVGLAVSHSGDQPHRILARADAAMYVAKAAGPGRWAADSAYIETADEPQPRAAAG